MPVLRESVASTAAVVVDECCVKGRGGGENVVAAARGEEGERRTAGTYVRGICGATTKQHGLFRRVCARNRSGSSVLLLIFIISVLLPPA